MSLYSYSSVSHSASQLSVSPTTVPVLPPREYSGSCGVCGGHFLQSLALFPPSLPLIGSRVAQTGLELAVIGEGDLKFLICLHLLCAGIVSMGYSARFYVVLELNPGLSACSAGRLSSN